MTTTTARDAMTKTCTKCGQTKPLDAYYGRRSWCKECLGEHARAWRTANPDKNRAQKRAWQAANPDKARARARTRYATTRARIVALKLSLSCTDCGWQPATETEVRRLEFDHVDPATKHTTGTRAAFVYGWTWPRIQQELALCEPRCKACHDKRSGEQRRDGVL